MKYWVLKSASIAFLVFFGLVNAFGHADSLRLEQVDGKYYVVHRIEKGETLYALSKRYAASIDDIVTENALEGNAVGLGQEIRVPIAALKTTAAVKENQTSEVGSLDHAVTAGETLFSISRKYNVSVAQIRDWNGLKGNELSIGQLLRIQVADHGTQAPDTPRVKSGVEPVRKDKTVTDKGHTGFTKHYVQSGELLETIARKYSVRPDSIVHWNKLTNTYLKIGQVLLIRDELKPSAKDKPGKLETLPYGTRRVVKDAGGFVKVFEEGAARKIDDDFESQNYLALHRKLKIGALIEVRNLMNNQKIFVRVVGKLPETGLNENVLVRLSPICFERLGVIDPSTRVEVSYFQD